VLEYSMSSVLTHIALSCSTLSKSWSEAKSSIRSGA